MYYRITYIHKGETKENPLYIPGDQDYCLVTAKLTLAMGKAGDLTVDIPTTNPAYDDIVCLTDEIIVYEGDDEIWRGRSTTLQTDFDRTGTLDCEGVLSYLYDTYFPPFDFSGSPKTLLQQVIDNHNKCVGKDSEKYIELGNVTVEDPNDYIARSSIDYNRSLEILQDKFVNESLGGFFRIRMENGVKKLDYLENYAQGSVASQEIRYAENLLDIAQEVQYTDTASAILPLGAKIEDEDGMQTDEYTTIAPVNGGSVYWQDDAAVASYGWICVCVVWDDVTDPSNLLSRAKTYLAQVSNAVQYFSVNAVDLSHVVSEDWHNNSAYANIFRLGVSILGKEESDPQTFQGEPWKLGDMIRLYSKPHNLNQYAELTEMALDLLNPDNDTYTFGSDTVSMTGSARNSARDLQTSLGELSVRMDNLSVNVINAVYANLEHIVAETITADYIWAEVGDYIVLAVEDLTADKATIEDLEAVVAWIGRLDANYVTVDMLVAEDITAGNIASVTAQILDLLGTSITEGTVNTIILTADNAIIDLAVIEEAVANTIVADLLYADYIDTNLIHIQSTDGTYMQNGSTTQYYDADGNLRIQIGLDASGNFTFVLYDSDGEGVMIDQDGIHESAVPDGLIVDSMVADNAAIQGSKLDIPSVITEIENDGSLTMQVSQVYLGDEGLDVYLAEIQRQIDSLDPSEYEKYGIYDVVDWFCVVDGVDDGEGNIVSPDPPEPYDDRAYAEVFALGKSILGQTESSSGWTTERTEAGEGQFLWWVREYLSYDKGSIWGTPVCLTDGYLMNTTTTLLTEFTIEQGKVEGLIERVNETEVTLVENGDTITIQQNGYTYFIMTEAGIQAAIGDVTQTVTEGLSEFDSKLNNFSVTVEGLVETVDENYSIMVNGFTYYESQIGSLVVSNEQITADLIRVEGLIDDLDFDGLSDFQAYYILSDDPENAPDTPRYDDRAYAAVFALGVSVLGNETNSSEWTTEKLTGAEGINLLNFYEGLNADVVYDAEETYLYMNAYGLQFAPGRTVTLSFEWIGDKRLIIVTQDGQEWEISESSYSWTTATFTFEVSASYEGDDDDPIATIFDPDSGHEIRHIKLELGSEATDFNTGLSLRYVWMSWRKIHTDGTVTWSEPELLTDAYTNVQWSYIHETLAGITMEVGKIDDLSIQVSTLEMTVEGITTTVTNITDPNNPDSLVYQMSEIDQKADSISSRVTSIENDYTTSSDLYQTAETIYGYVYSWNEDLYAAVQVELDSITMQVYSGVDGGAIMKVQVGESDEMYGRNLLRDTTYHEEITSKTYSLSDFAVENGSNQTVCLRFKARGEGTLKVLYSRNGSSSSEETWMTYTLPLDNFIDDDGGLIELDPDPDTWAFFEYQATPWTAPSSGGYIKFSLTGSARFAEAKLEFLDPTSELNSHGTSWTPAPEDDMTEFALDVRQYFANSNSIAYVAAGQIWFTGGTIGIDTNNFTLNTQGDMWARNAYLNNVAITGDFSSWDDDNVYKGIGLVLNGNDEGWPTGVTGVLKFVDAGNGNTSWKLLGALSHQGYDVDNWSCLNLFCYEDDFVAIGDEDKFQYVMLSSRHDAFKSSDGTTIPGRHFFFGDVWMENELNLGGDLFVDSDAEIHGKLTVVSTSAQITIQGSTASTEAEISCYHYNGTGIWFGVGAGGTNRGIWDLAYSRWMIYANASGNICFNGDIESNLVVRAGSTQIEAINSSDEGDVRFQATQNNGVSVFLGVGAGGYNRGIYDNRRDTWQIYTNQTGNTYLQGANVYLSPSGYVYCSSALYVTDQDGVYVDNVQTVWSNGSDVGLGRSGGSQGVYIWGGSISLRADTTVHGDLILNSTTYGYRVQVTGTSGYTVYLTGNGGGNLKAGISNGSYLFCGYSETYAYLGGASYWTNVVIGTVSSGQINIGTSLGSSGSVIIGTSSCSCSIAGYYIYWNGSTWTSSDRSIKDDIQRLDRDDDTEGELLDELDQLEPVQYHMANGQDSEIHYGYVADDVAEVMPELVREDETGLKYLGYNQIIPLLHLAIKKQNATIQELTDRIAELESALPKSK